MEVIATSAHAELTEIQWDSTRRFEISMRNAPKMVAEVCGPPAKGQSVA